MAGTNGFEWYDYLIFALLLVASLSTGVYQAFTGGKQRTTSEYLMGDRKLLMIPVAVSMFMTRVSSIMILGGNLIIACLSYCFKICQHFKDVLLQFTIFRRIAFCITVRH